MTKRYPTIYKISYFTLGFLFGVLLAGTQWTNPQTRLCNAYDGHLVVDETEGVILCMTPESVFELPMPKK